MRAGAATAADHAKRAKQLARRQSHKTLCGEPLTATWAAKRDAEGTQQRPAGHQAWRLPPDFDFTFAPQQAPAQHQGPTTTLLRGSGPLGATDTLERGVVVGHSIRCRNGVAVGHGDESSQLST